METSETPLSSPVDNVEMEKEVETDSIAPNKNYTHIAFYGITLPKKLSMINDDIQKNFSPPLVYSTSQKLKYEFQLLYLYPSKDKKKLVLRKRRICIGSKNVKDALDGDLCNSLTKKSMQTKGKKIILGGDDFDPTTYIQNGGFLDKRFWVYNLLWNNGDIFENYKKIISVINSDPRLKYIDVSKILTPKNSKVTAKKLRDTKKKPSVEDKENQTPLV